VPNSVPTHALGFSQSCCSSVLVVLNGGVGATHAARAAR
jgi:hypothetical protein